MRYRVLLTDSAERDVEDIYRHIARHDSLVSADRVLEALDDACRRLADMPERGNIPKELVGIGIADYREAHYKPYRIIYRVTGSDVTVYCIVDGRRDMQSFLERRLLR
ncbi:type II toxin-antitoxin system RelE/ParE family toxin [Taklimakanibacter lacteus]|uniref:type II toxin-antitoxin system RelE/ParE family toxin n=1 Tax=Taklimakanibacter lacteus TaxID=2268456 RepID=UPI000E662E37